jgi:hypothetical protein
MGDFEGWRGEKFKRFKREVKGFKGLRFEVYSLWFMVGGWGLVRSAGFQPAVYGLTFSLVFICL